MKPSERLHRIVAHSDADQPREPSDEAWLLGAVRQYMASPGPGKLEAALGLLPRWGQPGWWTTEARADRNALIAALDKQICAAHDIPAAARQIVQMVTARRIKGDEGVPPDAAVLLDQIGRTGQGVPGEKQLQTILRGARGNLMPSQISRHELPEQRAESLR